MTTVKITIDDSLPFLKLKSALSLIRGITKIEIDDSSVEVEREEYEQIRKAFLSSSKRSMAQHVNKYLQ
ncbi:MAG: hypothetical protein FWE30_07650 [Bacteroidales bacterium]|nr:hypothetical protein [Bacteroidales bacterium]